MFAVHRHFAFLLFSLAAINTLWSQNDSVVFKNDKHLVGKIEKMERGVMYMDVDFGEEDFQIHWEDIREIYTETEFLISMRNRDRFNGRFEGKADSLQIYTYNFGTVTEKLEDVVYLEGVDSDFNDRFSASIDLGLSLTKANNLRTLNTRSRLGYEAVNWNTHASINIVISEQDDQEERTRRTDGSLIFRYILRGGWFIFPEVNFLSSTEQNLELRTIAKAGAGNYLLRTNHAFWNVTGGASYTTEDFSSDQENRRSWELFVGTDLDLFDIGDFNFALSADAYPSLTESGRFRSDIKLDIKFDLPLDFYIRAGGTYNYDNQPAVGGSRSDYVVQSGLGWEF